MDHGLAKEKIARAKALKTSTGSGCGAAGWSELCPGQPPQLSPPPPLALAPVLPPVQVPPQAQALPPLAALLPPTAPLEHDHYDSTFNLFAVRNVTRFNEPVLSKPVGALHDLSLIHI